jgi:hypothetical protein
MTVHALCRLDEFGNADGKLPLDDANAGQSKRAPGGGAGATGSDMGFMAGLLQLSSGGIRSP